MTTTDAANLVGNILSSLLILATIAVAARKWLKKWIFEIATHVDKVEKKIDTNNGHTIGQYAERTAGDIKELSIKVGSLAEIGNTAGEALSRTKALEDRFDAFLKGLEFQRLSQK